MSMLIRYKKKGGFFQLVQLIETSNSKKREQFLSLIKLESPVWEAELRKKVLSLEKVLSWENSIISEIVSRIPTITLTTILQSRTKNDYDKLYSLLSFADQRKYQDNVANPPNAGEIQTAEDKVLQEVRNLISLGIIKLEKIDPSLIIQDNIEEHLESLSLNKSPKENEDRAELTSPTPVSNELNEIDTSKNSIKDGTPKTAQAPSQKESTDFDFLKHKLAQLTHELNDLRKENQFLKDKLEKIKKIA